MPSTTKSTNFKSTVSNCPACGAPDFHGACYSCGSGVFKDKKKTPANCPTCGASDFHGTCHACGAGH